MTTDQQIGFKIVEYNQNENRILVRPYSPLFKNPVDTYPIFNITITSLDPTKDVASQISLLLSQTVNSILQQESGNVSNIVDDLSKLMGHSVAVSLSAATLAVSASASPQIPSVINFVS